MMEKPPDKHNTVAVRLHAEHTQDLRRYNLPTANDEVAAIIPEDGSEVRSDSHDIILRLRGGGLRRISQIHPSYSTLHYVLLFPHGEDGWHILQFLFKLYQVESIDHQMSHNAATMHTDCILVLESNHCCIG